MVNSNNIESHWYLHVSTQNWRNFTSTLLGVAAISTELDSKEVPDEVIDVILYEAICSIRAKLKNFGKCGEIESSWDDHPEMSAAMRWIQERNLNL